MRTHRAPRRHGLSARGFTLIEIMVVVAIVAVMTSLAISGYLSVTRNARINGEVDVFAQFYRSARLRAVASGCGHVVRFVGSASTTVTDQRSQLVMYRKGTCGGGLSGSTVEQVTTGTDPLDIVLNQHAAEDAMLYTYGSNVSLADRVVYVAFDSLGNPSITVDAGGTWSTLAGTQRMTFRSIALANDPSSYSRGVEVTGAGDVNTF